MWIRSCEVALWMICTLSFWNTLEESVSRTLAFCALGRQSSRSPSKQRHQNLPGQHRWALQKVCWGTRARLPKLMPFQFPSFPTVLLHRWPSLRLLSTPWHKLLLGCMFRLVQNLCWSEVMLFAHRRNHWIQWGVRRQTFAAVEVAEECLPGTATTGLAQ